MIRIQPVPADVLELEPMAKDAASGRLAVRGLALPRAAGEVARPTDRMDARERAALATRLEAGIAPLAPHVAVLDAVRSLSERGACVVIAGQQPGFLVSPLYSLYKALQAVRTAELLRETWKVPVVALFWNHADDHDVAEVHHTNVVNANLDLQRIALAGLSSGRQPLSRIVLDDRTNHLPAIRALLEQLVAGAPHAERAIEVFVPRAGESIARAFTRSLTELLGPRGLVVLEPDWIRSDMSAHLARIVASDPRPALESGARQVRDAGYPIAIDPREAALLYRLDAGGRKALRAGGDGFRYDGEDGSRTSAELAAEIVQDPAAWSPGALLRPIVQDLCLPVAAYVGGYGELAYHAQLLDLRARASAPTPAFLPRVSCTLTDPECRVALAKLGASAEEILRARGSFGGDPTSDASSAPDVVAKMRAIAEQAARDLEALRAELAALDPSLAPQIKRAADGVRGAAEKLAEKAQRVHDNRSGKSRRHLRRANNLLFPRGEPQERVLGPLPFVARFGEDWITELAAAIDPFGAEHLLVHLGTDAQPGEET